jgi:hypothetical protein
MFLIEVSDSKSSGLDASISFESDRAENAGGKQFINVTIAQVKQFANVHTQS